MSIFDGKAQSAEGTFEIPGAGPHPAILVAIIDLGTHEETFQNEVKQQRKCVFVWHLTGTIADYAGDPGGFFMAKEFSLSFYPQSNLRKWLERWRGKPYQDEEDISVTKVLGRSCLLTVSHKTSKKGKTYANLEGVSPPMKGMDVPGTTVTPFVYEISKEEIAQSKPKKFPDPDWLPKIYGDDIRSRIAISNELRGTTISNAPKEEPVAAGTIEYGNPDDHGSRF